MSLGRYLVISRLGAGAMGVVYLAYDPELDRRVAIKLLHGHSDDKQGRIRFAREAQAMAQLSHPQVISVYDVGTAGDQVFVAMEYVQGGSLSQWLAAKEHSLEELLEVFILAGRGLAAAHRAGLVHRDFKPDNVLIGEDGRVRVSDFGLVRRLQQDDAVAPPQAGLKNSNRLSNTTPIGAGLSGAQLLTEAGDLLGTPAYMAPEQFRGELADERADQFSYCVALYEAVYGEGPFGGQTITARAEEVDRGAVRAAPQKSRVPLWLRSALLRGLSPKPEDRHRSMDALLAVLSRTPRWRGRILLYSLLATLILIVAGGVYLQRRRIDTLCSGGQSKLAGIWDEASRKRLHESFLASRIPYAEDAWQRVDRTLNRYLKDWLTLRQDACQATYVRGEQSPALLDLRMQCLNRRLQEVSAFLALLVKVDGATLDSALVHANELPPLSDCSDADALLAPVKPPENAQTRERVNALYQRLAQIRAFEKFGKYSQVLEQAKEATRTAEQLAYPPIAAEALYLLGDLEQKSGNAIAAEQTLYRAGVAGMAGRHHLVAAQSWVLLTFVVGDQLAKPEQGYKWGQLARAAVDATLGDQAVKADLLSTIGAIQSVEGRNQEAIGSHREALALLRRLLGPDHLHVAEELNNLGVVLRYNAELDEALAMHREALRIKEQVLGPAHPSLALSHANIALVLRDQQKWDESVNHMRSAVEIRKISLGIEHRATLEYCLRLAELQQQQGQLADAQRGYEEVLAVQEKIGARADLVRTRFLLAELFWNASKERARALSIAQLAADECERLGTSCQMEPATLAAWLTRKKEEPQ